MIKWLLENDNINVGSSYFKTSIAKSVYKIHNTRLEKDIFLINRNDKTFVMLVKNLKSRKNWLKYFKENDYKEVLESDFKTK